MCHRPANAWKANAIDWQMAMDEPASKVSLRHRLTTILQSKPVWQGTHRDGNGTGAFCGGNGVCGVCADDFSSMYLRLCG